MSLKKFKSVVCALLGVGLFCVPALADLYPHYWVPAYCTPPNSPAIGQPGYGPENPFTNGVYFNPTTGFWSIPPELWYIVDTSVWDRDMSLLEIIEDLIAQNPPQRPAWAIFDAESDGTYYWSGGYYGSIYHTEGFYLPSEF